MEEVKPNIMEVVQGARYKVQGLELDSLELVLDFVF